MQVFCERPSMSKRPVHFPHLVGTKRGASSKNDRQKRPRSQSNKPEKADVLDRKKGPTARRTGNQEQNGSGQNHFLELQRMVQEMSSNFNEELAKIKRSLHHPMYHMANPAVSNPPMAMNSPLIPHGPSMYPFLPPACYTPRLSS